MKTPGTWRYFDNEINYILYEKAKNKKILLLFVAVQLIIIIIFFFDIKEHSSNYHQKKNKWKAEKYIVF